MRGRADAGNLQQMRRVDGPPRQDHLARDPDLALLVFLPEDDADAALALANEPGREGLGLDAQVGSASCLRQEGARRRTAETAVARHLRIANALVLATVEILGEGKADLPRCIDEAMRQIQGRAVVLDQDRATLASLLGGTGRVALDRLEMRQHLLERPAFAAHL